jgi:hypothetical protein
MASKVTVQNGTNRATIVASNNSILFTLKKINVNVFVAEGKEKNLESMLGNKSSRSFMIKI